MLKYIIVLLPSVMAYTDREYWSGDQSDPWSRETYAMKEYRPDGYDDGHQRQYGTGGQVPERLSVTATRYQWIGVVEMVVLSVWIIVSVCVCCKPRRRYEIARQGEI